MVVALNQRLSELSFLKGIRRRRCIIFKRASMMLLFCKELHLSVTGRWHKKLPYIVQNLPKKWPKQNLIKKCHFNFLNCPETYQIFGPLLWEILLPKPFKNFPIWSHCSADSRFVSPSLFHLLFTSSQFRKYANKYFYVKNASLLHRQLEVSIPTLSAPSCHLLS